jgi:hypothetical protein
LTPADVLPTILAMSDDDLDPREVARVRRRDRDASAAHTELMRPGMGKVFKQILDAQAKAAKEPPKGRRRHKPG